MKVGELILQRRKELKLSRLKLGEKAGMSHTEIDRIERGERKMPSLPHLYALADALALPRETVLAAAGCATEETSPIERAFPALKSVRQRETIEKIADGLSRNGQLSDADLDDLDRQVEMFLQYAASRKKKD